MTVEKILVIPHGDELINHTGEQSRKMADTIRDMMSGLCHDVIAIMSPHGVRLGSHIPVVMTENLEGRIKIGAYRITGRYKTEKELARLILESNETFEEVGFITSSGPLSKFPLDFGTLIPLHFTDRRELVYLGQSRLKERKLLLNAGASFAKVISGYPRKILVIISADQAHTHSPDGPYGYSAMAARYEEMIISMFEEGTLKGIEEIPESVVQDAKPDSFWGLVFLRGVLSTLRIRMKMRYHYVERYFGMLAAQSE
ncbi:hypothetical protein ApAK_05495 [Thermoplasmatales archaeon AK]|nr:hypothetical protein [Thermoplasmatales archaeon AK]